LSLTLVPAFVCAMSPSTSSIRRVSPCRARCPTKAHLNPQAEQGMGVTATYRRSL
jgi:hypothetical protein